MTIEEFNKQWVEDAMNEQSWMPSNTDEVCKKPKVRILSEEDIKRICDKENNKS